MNDRASVWFVLALVLAASASARAQGPLRPSAGPPPGGRVLVMPFAVQSESAAGGSTAAWLGEAAAILVADDLDAHGLQLVPRDERVGAFDCLQLPLLSPLTR